MEETMFSATVARNCSRCRKQLTDPASVQSGVGPDCRGKDNRLLSLTIPANFPLAYAFLSQALTVAQSSGFPEEPLKVLDQTVNMFLVRSARARLAESEHVSETDWSGMDLREVIRNIDWLLSWGMVPTVRNFLIQAVEAAGYPALATVFRGDASMGECSFGFDAKVAKIWFAPKRNKKGAMALRSVAWGKLDWLSKRWLIPMDRVTEFETVVRSFYPMFTSSFETLRQEIDAHKTACAAQPASSSSAEAVDPSMPVATVAWTGSAWSVSTPWLEKTMYDFLAEMKNKVDYRDRKYSGGKWLIQAASYDDWRSVAEKYYRVDVTQQRQA